MNAELAVIGGVGFCLEGLADEIETPHGDVPVVFTRMKGRRVVFISRHGDGHLPPHKVNYRAIISAAKRCGASRVISTNTVGSMSSHSSGCIFLPYDFVEFTKSRCNTFFEDKAVHVDMSQPYCPELRAHLAEAARSLCLTVSEGIYVCSEGPHLESPAQIMMLRQFGDVVGMTGYPEVVLAKEAALCYASLCIVTNPACGLAGKKKLSVSEISDSMKKYCDSIREIIYRASQNIPAHRSCDCKDALSDASL
ncbi:MAG: putative 6-oxopurine nucleoside phosphorylase [Methanosaeta sp. PtaB.Bin018]|jgi:5'-methylthioadenosine phosphorylase|nr:MTAP family purine nucleoside phosphorylase [Methanothrix sp.]OPX74078.1 MAG: putative 6-oxopurine nucleoside phosphorylase [Methanosaeta sp. PtaB.Bin018]